MTCAAGPGDAAARGPFCLYRRAMRRYASNLALRPKSGQSLVESCIVTILICMILCVLLQISQLFAAKEILTYAAGRGARAKTVGFNQFMVYKTVRIGAIPNAGKLVSPELPTFSSAGGSTWTPDQGYTRWSQALSGGEPVSPQLLEETPRIPLYLGADWWGQLPAILDYDDWDSITHSCAFNGDLIEFEVAQTYPLKYPFHRTFYFADDIQLEGHADLEDHAALYMDDAGW